MSSPISAPRSLVSRSIRLSCAPLGRPRVLRRFSKAAACRRGALDNHGGKRTLRVCDADCRFAPNLAVQPMAAAPPKRTLRRRAGSAAVVDLSRRTQRRRIAAQRREAADEPLETILLFQSYRCSQFCPERRAASIQGCERPRNRPLPGTDFSEFAQRGRPRWCASRHAVPPAP